VSPLDALALTVLVATLTFIAGRQSVKRRFDRIKNSSGHDLVVSLDDRVLRIESTNQTNQGTDNDR
jgi:hypothetical protein